ncbi:MAG: 50S ribosomal protein L29 [Candidatus Gastranaerophilaceae bacterium]
MKLKEICERTIEELNEEVLELKKKLFELRMAKALQKLEDTSQISKTKKIIAQIKTVIKQKQI